jgi:hypothetical protein
MPTKDSKEIVQTSAVTTPGLGGVTEKDVEEFILGTDLANKLTEAEKRLAINTAVMSGLNPFKKEVHFVKYKEGSPLSIVVAYTIPIKRAELSGKLNGWSVVIDGEPDKKNTWKAVLTINRKDWEFPFVHETYYAEAVQTKFDGTPNSQWAKQPRFMLKKTAIGQGFRLCFPEETAGLPYIDGEVEDHEGRDSREVRQELEAELQNVDRFEGKAAREEREQSQVQTGTITKHQEAPEVKAEPEEKPLPWEEEQSKPVEEVASKEPMSEDEVAKMNNEVDVALSNDTDKVTENTDSADWIETATEENPVTEAELKMMYDLAAKKGFPDKDKFDKILIDRFKIENVTLLNRDNFTTTINGLAKAKDKS